MKIIIQILLIFAITSTYAAPTKDEPKRGKNRKQKSTIVAPQPTQPVVVAKSTAPAAKAKPKVDQQELDRRRIDSLNRMLTSGQRDSLVALWRESQSQNSYDNFFSNYIDIEPTDGGDVPDSIYINRLRDLASPIHLPYNNIVKAYIKRYTDPRYGTINRIIGMSKYYFPLIEEELIKAGLPVELRALPIIESALSASVVSPMGAMGLWQFMPITGKSYGLEINSLVDERCDPMQATRAACKFLKDLYAIYNDWSLAIAAYNCGPGNVNKAITRAGGEAKSFWDVYEYLPRETRGYVPAFIAASYAYAYHQQYNIKPIKSPMPISIDTVHVNRLMHLEQISSSIDVPIETLRLLNPQYKQDIIPATTKNYVLILPQREVSNYITQQDSIFSKDSIYLKEYLNPANVDAKLAQKAASSITKTYKVKKGDTLGAIARRHGVTTTQIMRWNGLKSENKISIGQRLRIQSK